jgi:4-amino-4-deoxy-L-arabinose transferase-like glycosyltransferase
MRRLERLRTELGFSYAIFAVPAAFTIFIFIAALAAGKINTVDVAEYLKHSRVVFGGVLSQDSPFDYAAYRPPFFGAIIALAGEISKIYQVHIALTINLLVSLTALWLVFISRLAEFGKAGRICLVLMMFANIWFFREVFTLRETAWYALFCITFVLICRRLYTSAYLGILMGIVSGLAMLTRPTGVVFVVASTIIIAMLWMGKILSIRKSALAFGSMIVAVGIVILPWQIYMYKNFDRTDITGSCSGGFTFFKGNHPIMGNLEPAIDLDAADAFVWDYAAKHIHDASQAASLCARSDFLGEQVRASIAENPVRFLKSVSASLAYILAPMPVPLGGGDVRFDDATQQLKIEGFNSRKVTSFVSVFYYAGLYVLAFAGLLLTRRRREELLWVGPVLLLILGHAAAYAATLAEIRFRMPFEPLLCVLAAIAVQHLMKTRPTSPNERASGSGC